MKIKKMSDEECLAKFIEFLEERVSITTNFIVDPDTDNLTHQILQITCGPYTTISNPEPLEAPLRLATAKELHITLQ